MGWCSSMCLAVSLLLGPASGPEASVTPGAMAADFDLLWSTLDAGYAYFDRKVTDWACVKQRYGPEAAKAASPSDFVTLLERTLDELYDPHTHLKTNTPASTRLVPSGLDVWAEWQDGRAVITQLRPGFGAEQAGLRPGMRLLTMGGVPIEEAVGRRIGACVPKDDPGARSWALLALLAGTHDTPRRLEVEGPDGKPRPFELDRPEHLGVGAPPPTTRVASKVLDGSIGYLQVSDLGSDETLPLFDAALHALRDTRALILDLRDTPGGGNTAVAEPMLGRFVERTQGYQRILPRGGEPWVRTVSPRGPAYRAPLVVLVGRWTGSMAEGMAIGLDGMGRATVVGTRMAGLNGAVFDLDLPNTRIRLAYAGEKLSHLDGTPREDFVPRVLVDLSDPEVAGLSDPILEVGLRTARRLAGETSAAPAVESAERAWSDAFLRHDVATISKLLADDFVGIDGRGVVSDKAAELKEAAVPAPGFDGPVLVREDLSDIRVRSYGTTAVLTATNAAQFLNKGESSTIRYRRTTVWVSRDGRWQCVSFHGSRILEEGE